MPGFSRLCSLLEKNNGLESMGAVSTHSMTMVMRAYNSVALLITHQENTSWPRYVVRFRRRLLRTAQVFLKQLL